VQDAAGEPPRPRGDNRLARRFGRGAIGRESKKATAIVADTLAGDVKKPDAGRKPASG